MKPVNATVQELPKMVLSMFIDDRRKCGWEIVENVPLGEGEISLRLDDFLREGEEFATGDVVLERAKAMGCLAGQLHAEHLLQRQKDVPPEWREFALIFPGTVWRGTSGLLSVPCLFWLPVYDGRWDLSLRWFNGNLSVFFYYYRLVRLNK